VSRRLDWHDVVTARVSLGALRHRLSRVLPLSPTSREVCDPAVLVSGLPETLTLTDERRSFIWATIISIQGHGYIGYSALELACEPEPPRFDWHTVWRQGKRLALTHMFPHRSCSACNRGNTDLPQTGS
jgi:hypothetical protein